METEMIRKALENFVNAPGLCNHEELMIVKNFLTILHSNLNLYIDCVGHHPLGETIPGQLDRLNWYIDRAQKTED